MWSPPSDNKTLAQQSDAFRKHGLIMLYRICGRHYRMEDGTPSHVVDDESLDPDFRTETEEIIQQQSRDVVDALEDPSRTWHMNLDAIPLLTAGAELPSHDTHRRDKVVSCFKSIYSINRIPANLMAIKLLEEVWLLRDIGYQTSWLEIMLQHGWRLMLG